MEANDMCAPWIAAVQLSCFAIYVSVPSLKLQVIGLMHQEHLISMPNLASVSPFWDFLLGA
jgi:hypothetical protein